MGTEWLYGDCGTVCTAALARACDGRRTTNYTAERTKKSGGKKKLLYLKEKRQRLISQELPDGKDVGTGDKPNPSPLFYLIQ